LSATIDAATVRLQKKGHAILSSALTAPVVTGVASFEQSIGRWGSLSEIINPNRYLDPQWDRLHRDLEAYSVDKHVFHHLSGEVVRKGYELTQCIFGLAALGMLRPEAQALGVGAGHEPVIFWLSDHIAHVVATDLYGNETWSTSGGAEATADVFDRPERYCPHAFTRDKITFQNADGTQLPFADETFDFCWSLSSIEHFGGPDAAATAMREMARVTKPGGIVCVATEVLLRDDQAHPEAFTRKEFNRYVLRASPSLVLVGRMRWNLKSLDEYIRDPIILPQDVHRLRRHVVMQAGEVQWTSAIAFLRKGGRTWSDAMRWLPPRKPRKWVSPLGAADAKLPYSINRHLVHNYARCEKVGESLRVKTPDQPWSYAVEMPLQDRALSENHILKIEISARVQNNPVCIGVLKPDGTAFSQETEIRPNAEAATVEIVIPPNTPIGSLMVRTASGGSSAVEFEITTCQLPSPAGSS
jgi:SAM-dependent methyltransferase